MWEKVKISKKWLHVKSLINPVIFQIGPATAQKHYAQKWLFKKEGLTFMQPKYWEFCTCSLMAFPHICPSLQTGRLSHLSIYNSDECTWAATMLPWYTLLLRPHSCRLHSWLLPTSVWGIASHIRALSQTVPLWSSLNPQFGDIML